MLGELHNTNTVDKFKECDKKEMISEAGKKVNSIACSSQSLTVKQNTQLLYMYR